MKTLVIALIAGALSTTAAFAGTATTPLPVRPLPKRPSGARQPAMAQPSLNLATPQLPFRPYEKRPAGRSNKPNTTEAASR